MMQSRHESQDTWVLCLRAQTEQHNMSEYTVYLPWEDFPAYFRLPPAEVKTSQLCACTTPGSVVLATCFAYKGNWHSPSSVFRSDPHTKKKQQRFLLKKKTPVKLCGTGLQSTPTCTSEWTCHLSLSSRLQRPGPCTMLLM